MNRVAYVLKVFPRLSQTFIVSELRAHARAGFEVVVFSLRRPRPEDRDLIVPPLAAEVVWLDGPDEALPDQLAREIAARGITHLHAHFARLATEVARRAAQATGITYSFTAHARDIFETSEDPAALGARIRDAADVITVSQFNVDHLERTFGRRATLVYNGLDLTEFPFESPADRPPVILGVGRLIAKKGFRFLLEACAMLRDRGVPFRAELIGDGEERAALADLIGELDLVPHVRLLGALVPSEVAARMRRAALLAAPCVIAADGDRDGLPTVLLEAMALGTPCVATRVTGIPEAIRHDETGLLVRPRDGAALADACTALLVSPARRERLAANARRHVATCFSSEANTRVLRARWGLSPVRVLFRVSSRRGLGHWMRSVNVAAALLRLEPAVAIRILTRGPAPCPPDDPRIVHQQVDDATGLDRLPPAVEAFDPQVVIDDTMPPATTPSGGRRHVFVMRRCAPARQAELFANPIVAQATHIIVPHEPAEFGYEIPPSLAARVTFVGPVVRCASEAAKCALAERLGLTPGGFLLVSTPGGGGFAADGARLLGIAARVHRRLAGRLAGFRHVVVLGPNSTAGLVPVDGSMTVLKSEPEMAALIALADAVLSAGGYNTVGEIRLARRPAFFLPGQRTHDDQRERVLALAGDGCARLVESADPEAAADEIAAACGDPAVLVAMRRAYEADRFEPGNAAAAQVILTCATS